MLFIPQEIKEKIAKLEDENAQLHEQVEQLQTKLQAPPPKQKKNAWPGIFLVLLLLSLGYIGFLHWQQTKQPKQVAQTEQTTFVAHQNGAPEKWNAADHPEVVYRVQLGAYANFDINTYKQNLDGLHRDSIDGFNKVSLGAFRNLQTAQNFLNEMLRLGLENCYIVAYKNNEPIGLIEAKKQEQP